MKFLILIISAWCSIASGSYVNWTDKSLKYCALKNCQHYGAYEYEYDDFFSIEKIRNSQPDGYLLNLQVFAIGQKNFHVVLSPKLNPDWHEDLVYEILVGGWGNTRTVIRKQKNSFVLKDLVTPSVLNVDEPNEILIQITQHGEIKVIVNGKTMAEAYDPVPLPIKYLSFASYESTKIEYFYDCPKEGSSSNTSSAVTPLKFNRLEPTSSGNLCSQYNFTVLFTFAIILTNYYELN